MQATLRDVSNITFVNECVFRNSTVIDVLHTKKCVPLLLSVVDQMVTEVALDTDIDQHFFTCNEALNMDNESIFFGI